MRAILILSFILLLLDSSSTVTSLAQHLQGGSCDDWYQCGLHGTCVRGRQPDTFWCRCDIGYGGELCQQEWPDDVIIEPPLEATNSCPKGFAGPNCDEPDKCFPNPCRNGSCSSFHGGYQCLCDQGYTGSYCEKGNDFCANHTCPPLAVQCINTRNAAYCLCPAGKFGPDCDKTSCESLGPDVCNGGTCRDASLYGINDNPITCECPAGYEGEFCTRDKNECLQPGICMNNGTCVNTPGGYRCECRDGYTGADCGELVDLCKQLAPCQNGGECAHLSDRTPVCTCPQGFYGERCESKCPPGYGGWLCTLPRNRPFCSRFGGAQCFNGAKCLGGFCKCPPEFVGDRCEMRRNEVNPTRPSNCYHNNQCLHNSTCVNLDDEEGYTCICKPGFSGRNCEVRNLCSSNMCANGGTCNENTSMTSSPPCKCPIGFQGDYCEEEEQVPCALKKCENNGKCVVEGTKGVCQCPYGFTGARCQNQVQLGETKQVLAKDLCQHRNCSLKASNGICDKECNLLECNFDGGDCSGGTIPFQRCPYKTCSDRFANGRCDQECNNEACLYDGLDCQTDLYACPDNIRAHCIAVRNNGQCDQECSFIGCGFDGGDCNSKEVEAMILTNIHVKVQQNPMEFQLTGGQSLMEISSRLRATVRIQRDEQGPLVFEWNGHNETKRVPMDTVELEEKKVLSKQTRTTERTKRSAIFEGIVLYLEVEEVCQPPISKCRFSTAQSVVDLIAAGLVKSDGRTSWGLPIMEAMVAPPHRFGPTDTTNWTSNQWFLVALIAFFAVGSVAAGVIIKAEPVPRRGGRKRPNVDSEVWTPTLTKADVPNDKKRKNNQMMSVLEEPIPKRSHSDQENHNYSQIYPQTLANGFYGQDGDNIMLDALNPRVEWSKQRVVMSTEFYRPLHKQAAGPYEITDPITAENVNLTDPQNHRRILHCLCDNQSGKPEDAITRDVIKCIEAGADLDAVDIEENTAMMLAVKARRIRVVVHLLRAHADPTIYNRSEQCALHLAIANRDVRIVTTLLTDARMLKEINEPDENGMTPLMMCANAHGEEMVRIAKELIKAKARVNLDDRDRMECQKFNGRTALHYAALIENIPMMELLLSEKANPDKADGNLQTPLMLAAKAGQCEAVKYLVEQGEANVQLMDHHKKDAKKLAQEARHHEIAAYLNEAASAPKKSLEAKVDGRRKPRAMGHVKRACSKKGKSTATPTSMQHMTPPQSSGESVSSPSPRNTPDWKVYPTPPQRSSLTPIHMSSSSYSAPSPVPSQMWYRPSENQSSTPLPTTSPSPHPTHYSDGYLLNNPSPAPPLSCPLSYSTPSPHSNVPLPPMTTSPHPTYYLDGRNQSPAPLPYSAPSPLLPSYTTPSTHPSCYLDGSFYC